jgi:SAM-dependent methyltransferase
LSALTKRIIRTLKNVVPLDLGQGNLRTTTQGKVIALGLVPPGNGRTALDVGAREGDQTRWLEAHGYEVTSIDVAPGFPECRVVDCNDRLPFPDHSFDLVWSSEVIEHLREPAFSLSELRRVTKPGGRIILTTPNSYALIFRFIALFGLTPQRIQREDHLHFFGVDDIRALAPDARVYGYFPYVFVKRTVQRGVGALSPTFVLEIEQPGD